MRVSKTRTQLLGESYLNKKDIQTLFKVSRILAKKTFDKAKEMEVNLKGDYILYENKVPIKMVLKLLNIDFNLLLKQVKSTEE